MMDTVRGAIRERRMLGFVYNGLARIAEPHVAGIKGGRQGMLAYQTGGRQGMLAYQTGGQSSSGGLPEWRRFYLDKISGLCVLKEGFDGPRPYPSGRHSSWDSTIAVVR